MKKNIYAMHATPIIQGITWYPGRLRGLVTSAMKTKLLNRYGFIIPAIVLLLLPLALHSQADLTITSTVLGTTDITATNSITLNPGFEAKDGCNFYAHISATAAATYPAVAAVTTTATSAMSGKSTISTSYNYIRTISYLAPFDTEQTGDFEHLEQIGYFDGLGRPIQAVSVMASPNKADIIQPIVYDAYGREVYKPMAYIDDAKDGSFRTGITNDDLSKVNAYYNTQKGDNRAFAQIGYDNSPLNRVVSQTGPGNAWSGKSTTIDYLTNTGTVNGWDVTGDYTYTPISYPASSLYITQTTDEEGHVNREYKDKQGQVVLKESVLDTNTTLQTFYIYDDFGLLRCVVPPLANGDASLTNLCYSYRYDSRNRMIEKKIPGGGMVKMVYDSRDRLRLTQNSLQSSSSEWNFTKYDVLNRPIMNGIFISTLDVTALATAINDADMNESFLSTGIYCYTSGSYPKTGLTIHSVSWYDDYSYQTAITSLSTTMLSETYDNGSFTFSSTKDLTPIGRVTGTMTRVLSPSHDNSTTITDILYSSVYYDKYGNVLRSISQNMLGGEDITSTIYKPITFLPQQIRQQHISSSETVSIVTRFDYDHTGRVLATYLKVNDQDEITQSMAKYNEIGEMITKYLHSDKTDGTLSFRQKTDYTYNIRGWLTQINDPALSSDNDLFGMELCYNNVTDMGSLAPTGLFNGNIAGIKWQIKNDIVRGYGFTYDKLNRLTSSNYADGSSLATNIGAFNENIPEYDKNGNIKQLNRFYAGSKVDALAYTYLANTNQIKSIADAGETNTNVDDYTGVNLDYTYDENGNMKFDGGRDISLTYNPTINLPNEVDFGSNNRIFYYYTAGGAKLLKHVAPSSGSDTYTTYVGNFVYEDGKLAYILTSEGRLIPNGTGTDRKFLYEYTLKDHLGNSRVTFMGTDLGNALDVVQTNSYYPFGLSLLQNNGNTSDTYKKNKYLYNDKEIQDDNLNSKFFGMLDYGARFYDPQIGRWHSVDPLAEWYFRHTPYNYCFNNPIKYVDPSGMDVTAIAGGYRITGADIYNYFGYLKTISNEKDKKEQTKMMSSLCLGLSKAAEKNNGKGGSMSSTVDAVDVDGKNKSGKQVKDNSPTFGFVLTSEDGKNGTNPNVWGPELDWDFVSWLVDWTNWSKKYSTPENPIPKDPEEMVKKSIEKLGDASSETDEKFTLIGHSSTGENIYLDSRGNRIYKIDTSNNDLGHQVISIYRDDSVIFEVKASSNNIFKGGYKNTNQLFKK